ncbi:MAG TPA: hypothetical protein VM327_05640 [Candidatus Thermoplasmatota archaeon]|nr:hypothetical protein [Candidatus Thermoplasmatota archaeon]
MKAKLLLSVAIAFLFLGLAPAAQAQNVGITNPEVSTPTTLYMHLIDFQDFPINTQPPDDRFVDATAIGLATHSLNCVDNPPAGGAPLQDNHKYYGYSSPSYVEYNFEQDGKPRTHPERGISYDAVMDSGAPFFLYWYMSTMPYGAPSTPQVPSESAPVVIPNVVVKATIRAGDAISVDDTAYDTGPELAGGQTVPATLAGATVQPNTAGQTSPDVTPAGNSASGAPIFQFKVPMTITSPVIPRATGYNLRIDMYVEDPAGQCTDKEKFMPNAVKVYTDPTHRPRMELSILDPIRLEYLHPQFVGDDLVIHTSMNSAWGNYDVNEQDPDGISVSVEGPSPATSLAKAAIVQRTHEHYHHQEAVDITYVWPYKTDRAQNGLYTVTVNFMNDQRSATATGIAQFEIGKGRVIGCGGVQEAAQKLNDDCGVDVQEDGVAKKDSPGFELVGVLGVVAAALFVARRRK